MAEGVPQQGVQQSPVTKAMLEAGYVWEERVIHKELGKAVKIAPGTGPVRDRAFSGPDTLIHLKNLKPGESLYQGTLDVPASFLDHYGLDPQLVQFSPCRPDLIQCPRDGSAQPGLRIIDIKASDALKASHRVQTAVYALMLRDIVEAAKVKRPVDLGEAGVWLYGEKDPEWFELSTVLGTIETFLREQLVPILTTPLSDVPWHLFYRCEWCEYFGHCRAEADALRSVSLIPFLSTGARDYLRQAPWPGGKPIHTLPQLKQLLAHKDVERAFDACGSLRGRTLRMRNIVTALETEKVVPHGGSSLSLPVTEQIRILLALQNDPVSGAVYAAGFRRLMGKAVYGTGSDEAYFVAETPEDCTKVQSDFLRALSKELHTAHEYNQSREWKDQKSLQVYVFDTYELRLLNELLLDAMGDPKLAPIALQLLFHFQDPGLANAEEHPNREVLFPIIAIASVIRDLLAVPVPLALRLPEVMKHLHADGFEFKYKASDLFNFELSNALKSDAIHLAWHKGREEAVDWIKSELRRRLIAASSVLDGLREQVKGQLFAWPPKFQLATALKFQHPELSRIAFMVRYECVMAALAVRESRCLPRYERLREAISIPLRFEGGSHWKVMSEVDQSAIEAGSGMPDKLLVPDDEEGERDQMCYDDHRSRSAWWAPRSSVRLASVQEVSRDDSGRVTYLNLNIIYHKEQQPFQKSARAVLHPRFTDFNSDRIVKRLQELDTEPEADFLTLIRAPRSFARNVPSSQKLKTAAPQERLLGKLTPSQSAALEQLLSNRLTLVWGPPGTGKTHFLAQAILRIVMRLACRGETIRVGVAAFTHAAIENLLREIQDLAIEKGITQQCGVYKLKYCSTPRGETLTTILEENTWSIPQDSSVVVGGTVYSFFKAVSKAGFPAVDLLVIDEASQMKMGELALCAIVLKPGGRLVFAGDDLQLPPIIQGEYPLSDDGLPGLQDSVFAYLRARDRTKDPYTWPLLENWRMNATLSRFPAETLYDIHRNTDHFLGVWRKIGGDVFQRDECPNIHEKSTEKQRRRSRPLLDPLGDLRFGAGVLLGIDGGDGLQDAVRLREASDASVAVFITLGDHSRGIDAIQDIEHVGRHAARQRAGQHDRLVDGGGKCSERVSLRGVGGFCLVDFVGDAKLEEVRKKTPDEFNGCVAADSGAVSLPKGTVERFPGLGFVAATQRYRFQGLGVPFLLAEVIAQQAFVIENNGTAAIRVDYRAVVVTAPRDLVAVPPEASKLRPISAADDEMRPWPVFSNPTVPSGFVFAPQPHVGERGVNAIADNAAIPKPQFVDSLRARLTWSQRPQAVDHIRPGAGDRLQNLTGRLLKQLRRYDEETGVRASCCKHVSDSHGHERLASAHFGDDGNRVGLLEPFDGTGDRDFLGGKRLSQKFSQDWRDRFAGCVESGEAG
jgi:hypothetical protein